MRMVWTWWWLTQRTALSIKCRWWRHTGLIYIYIFGRYPMDNVNWMREMSAWINGWLKKKWRTRHSISVSVHLLTPPTANKFINLCKSAQHWFASNKWRWSTNMQTISWLVFSLSQFFVFILIIIVGICFAFYWYSSRNIVLYIMMQNIILIAF